MSTRIIIILSLILLITACSSNVENTIKAPVVTPEPSKIDPTPKPNPAPALNLAPKSNIESEDNFTCPLVYEEYRINLLHGNNEKSEFTIYFSQSKCVLAGFILNSSNPDLPSIDTTILGKLGYENDIEFMLTNGALEIMFTGYHYESNKDNDGYQNIFSGEFEVVQNTDSLSLFASSKIGEWQSESNRSIVLADISAHEKQIKAIEEQIAKGNYNSDISTYEIALAKQKETEEKRLAKTRNSIELEADAIARNEEKKKAQAKVKIPTTFGSLDLGNTSSASKLFDIIKAGNNLELINKSGGIFHGLEYEEGTVSYVKDGDTIVLTDGREIRYLGVDTRERGQCYYNEATNANKLMVMTLDYNSGWVGKKVRLYKGTVDKGPYKRYLRYVTYITVYPVTEWFVNNDLIRWGYGINRTDYKDQQLPHIYQTFVNSENQARANLEGLWGACR